MNLAKFNPSFLATGLSVALLGVVTGATVTACAKHLSGITPQAQKMQKRHPANAKNFEQRLQAMQAPTPEQLPMPASVPLKQSPWYKNKPRTLALLVYAIMTVAAVAKPCP
ncbi:MAG: hypothetical protein U1E98_05135 [Moraxella osloensis]